MERMLPLFSLVFLLISITQCFPIDTLEVNAWEEVKTFRAGEDQSRAAAASTRMKATTITQSINNWVPDVDTVDSFHNVALGLPISGPLKAGASKTLAFAQDEPVNLKFLKATPGLDAAGMLEKVFGDVLSQLGNVVNSPTSLPVAINAVARINTNRCKNVLPSAETLWRSAATAANISTATWPPKANRENACLGNN